MLALVGFLNPALPVNAGLKRLVTFTNPEGQVTHALPPAPVNNYFPTMQLIYGLVMKCLGELDPVARDRARRPGHGRADDGLPRGPDRPVGGLLRADGLLARRASRRRRDDARARLLPHQYDAADRDHRDGVPGHRPAVRARDRLGGRRAASRRAGLRARVPGAGRLPAWGSAPAATSSAPGACRAGGAGAGRLHDQPGHGRAEEMPALFARETEGGRRRSASSSPAAAASATRASAIPRSLRTTSRTVSTRPSSPSARSAALRPSRQRSASKKVVDLGHEMS